MLKATEEEIEGVREYFEWQAPDLEVTFMQKVYSEAVLNTRHDVWDIHTNKDRWWVITGGINLYSQEQFPNMDLALTFHIGKAGGRIAAFRMSAKAITWTGVGG